MKFAASGIVAFAIWAAVAAYGQDKPALGARSGVLNLRDAMSGDRNTWIAEIDAEVQKLQQAEAGRASDLNPQERARIRAKITDLSNKRRLEVYVEIVRLSGVIAKERGFDVIQRVDRMPALEAPELDLAPQIDRRSVIAFDPSVDITSEVVLRINARKK